MSGFGDFEEADAFDTEPADAEQVARRLHRYRREDGREPAEWDDLAEYERVALVAIVRRLLDWLRRQGALR